MRGEMREEEVTQEGQGNSGIVCLMCRLQKNSPTKSLACLLSMLKGHH